MNNVDNLFFHSNLKLVHNHHMALCSDNAVTLTHLKMVKLALISFFCPGGNCKGKEGSPIQTKKYLVVVLLLLVYHEVTFRYELSR
jgi:hypothetical protein